MKGMGGIFVLLSLVGILLGFFLIWYGIGGNGLSAPFVVVLGIFIAIKEILDLAH